MSDLTVVSPEPVPPEPEAAKPAKAKRATRKPLAFWDRAKWLIMLAGLWLVLWWSLLASDPLITPVDAAWEVVRAKRWIFFLAGVEMIRQAHYLLSEEWGGWHWLWSEKLFGGFERTAGRKFSPWTRYRIGRAFKALIWIAAIAVVTGALTKTPPVVALFQLPVHLWSVMPMILQVVFVMAAAVLQFVAIFWFMSRGGVDVYFPDDIKTRFSDVWGQDHVVDRVRECMVFLENPESIEDKGGHVPGGILLWGPPGTGKTLMAEAVAGETGKPYVFVDPGAFIQMFFGVGILKVKALFRKLRKLSLRYGGVIVFFDEADSLGSRGSMQPGGAFGHAGSPVFHSCNGLNYASPGHLEQLLRHGALADPEPPRSVRDKVVMGMGGGGMGTLQALLTELSGLKKPRGFFNRIVRRSLGMRPKAPPKYRILVMMATNMPDALDEALLRPGRIDRIFKVGYPSKQGRVRTYKGYLDKVQHKLTEANIEKMATITPYASGAVIKDLVNEALIHAIRNDRDVITWEDMMAGKHLKTLGPPEDVEYIERERHAIALHEACHAVTAHLVRHRLVIDIATIEKASNYLGMVQSIKAEDLFSEWKSDCEADIMVSLASLAGEKLFFEGDSSTGVSGDLESATLRAVGMEGYWGMGSTVASHGVATQLKVGGGRGPGGDKKDDKDWLDGSLGQRVETILADLLARCVDLLTEHRHAVLSVTHALEVHKTIAGDDVIAIIEQRRGPLLDGGAYAEPGVAAALEEYHRIAVGAHQAQGPVGVPLPRFAPRALVGAGVGATGNGHEWSPMVEPEAGPPEAHDEHPVDEHPADQGDPPDTNGHHPD